MTWIFRLEEDKALTERGFQQLISTLDCIKREYSGDILEVNISPFEKKLIIRIGSRKKEKAKK